jgi:hypothetical protein
LEAFVTGGFLVLVALCFVVFALTSDRPDGLKIVGLSVVALLVAIFLWRLL